MRSGWKKAVKRVAKGVIKFAGRAVVRTREDPETGVEKIPPHKEDPFVAVTRNLRWDWSPKQDDPHRWN